MVSKNTNNTFLFPIEDNDQHIDFYGQEEDRCLHPQQPNIITNGGDSRTLDVASVFSFTPVNRQNPVEEVPQATGEVLNDQTSTINVSEHFCGEMNNSCSFCDALYFAEEANISGEYKSCCHFGKVKLQRTQRYPEPLKDLMSNRSNPFHKNFKANIRSYNSSLSFASMGAQIESLSNGPYCFKIHGQVYHNTFNLNNSYGQRKYSQLYVVDTDLATDTRLSLPHNTSCNREVMRSLDTLIREVNPYAHAYKTMSEIEANQRQNGMPIKDISMVFNRNINRDQRRYNAPVSNEIAMIFTDPNGEPPFERDVRVYSRRENRDIVQLNILSPHIDPMSYVLFFPHGESGWQPNLRLPSYHGDLQKISLLQYKVSQICVKRGVFNPILWGGKLFQQWIVDSYLQVEANNLNFIKHNQRKLRVDYYKGLVDYVNNGESSTSKPVILPSTFQGSPRNMRERYHDAMAIVTKYGKPDLFITMTCNPNWKEIKDNLFEGQSPSDRPDLVARVFNLKLKSLMGEILSGKVFGEVVAHVHTIEFQKRGLPHAHILIILKDKIDSVFRIDELVSAEIPEPSVDKQLHDIVMKHMIHGPCGDVNPLSPCMENGICSKEYPKEYVENTFIHRDGYPLYKRSRGGAVYTVRGKSVTNANVVPHNKYLLKRYNCHINVEVCTSIKSVKYIFKYIYKGYDCAEVQITDNNEIDHYVNSRYVSAPEAIWRLCEYKMHGRSHKIIRLPVHLPREQMIVFEEGHEQEAIRNSDVQSTQLLAWFKLNERDESAREHLYTEIPFHYVFVRGEWKRRKRMSKVISRLYAVSPSDKERFFLRLLLLNVKGATSFDYLRSFEGVVYATFEEAAEARGLLQNDLEWDRVLEEAVSTQTPGNIRYLFGYICSFNRPRSPRVLFEKFYEDMIEDFQSIENPRDRLLSILKDIVSSHGWSLHALGLPEPSVYIETRNNQRSNEVVNIEEMVDSLNVQQREAFDQIVSSVGHGGSLFFLDGPAGSGKTYLYNVLTAYLKRLNKSVVQLATTGIAADLLEDGRTIHSGMKLPVPLNELSVSRLQPNTGEGLKVMDASLILIDEVSMMSKYALDAIDEVLKRLHGSNDAFGGKTILLGGDFRQASNIVIKGTPLDIIERSLPSARSWINVNILRLDVNMRSSNQGMFTDWLLSIGNGSSNDQGGQVVIPDVYLEKNDLVSSIFGDQMIEIGDESIYNKIILTTKNDHANMINGKVSSLIRGTEKTYRSADTIVSDDPNETMRYPTEFLNRQQPSGMPPHELRLKKGSVIMLLRNLDPKRGLLNGIRLCVQELHSNFIVGQVISGKSRGITVSIPRIDMMPSETVLPFMLRRRQFPVVLSFAMTIHKSQGQSFDKVGVYLPEPVFAHGQLYVALSRVRDGSNLRVCLSSDANGKTKNVVYKALIDIIR